MQYDFGFPQARRETFGPPLPPHRRTRTLPIGPHRLFLAAIPDPDMAASVWKLAGNLQHRHDLRGALLPAQNLHMTGLFLGGHDALTQGLVDNARRIGAAVFAPPFEFTFTRTMSFLHRGRRPFVMSGDEGADEFAALQQSMWTAAVLDGKAPGSTPHITLLWADKLIPVAPLETPIPFAVEEIVLVYSHYGTGRHEHLGRWRLRG